MCSRVRKSHYRQQYQHLLKDNHKGSGTPLLWQRTSLAFNCEDNLITLIIKIMIKLIRKKIIKTVNMFTLSSGVQGS